MKIKPTPLFLFSCGMILYSLYMFFFVDPGEEGWGTLAAMVLFGAGVGGILIYLAFRRFFKTRIWKQVAVEVVLGSALFYYVYKQDGYYDFRLPHNYRGYVIVVYGVDDAPALKTHFYSNKLRMTVPASGVILTSSSPKKNYDGMHEFSDSTLGNIENLSAPLRRYNIPYPEREIDCLNKKYDVRIWLIKDEPNWMAIEDSINGLDRKLAEACALSDRSVH